MYKDHRCSTCAHRVELNAVTHKAMYGNRKSSRYSDDVDDEGSCVRSAYEPMPKETHIEAE